MSVTAPLTVVVPVDPKRRDVPVDVLAGATAATVTAPLLPVPTERVVLVAISTFASEIAPAPK
ncbi:MAG UNVERIFIED_CONTAM: hypothetical protein LVR18_34655 [Planctomycetaceae bacterium]|jgi:hypothetical protein